jgi:Trk-type K+ transport systems, membrane components
MSLFPDSLEGYASNAPVLVTVALLVILGGIGFLVLIEILEKLRNRGRKFSVHARVVLVMTALLVVIGTLGIWAFEANNTFAGHSAGYGLLNSFFQSAMTRTAGFNSIAISACDNLTAFFMTALMFIGASPGGTGGGIKTTTFVLVLLFILIVLRERDTVTLYRRRIPRELVRKSLAILILTLFALTATTALLELTWRYRFIDSLFEAASAISTVGLSRGLTQGLTTPGKIVIILAMLIGRVGPLVFLLAILREPKDQGEFKYPEEKIFVG